MTNVFYEEMKNTLESMQQLIKDYANNEDTLENLLDEFEYRIAGLDVLDENDLTDAEYNCLFCMSSIFELCLQNETDTLKQMREVLNQHYNK